MAKSSAHAVKPADGARGWTEGCQEAQQAQQEGKAFCAHEQVSCVNKKTVQQEGQPFAPTNTSVAVSYKLKCSQLRQRERTAEGLPRSPHANWRAERWQGCVTPHATDTEAKTETETETLSGNSVHNGGSWANGRSRT